MICKACWQKWFPEAGDWAAYAGVQVCLYSRKLICLKKAICHEIGDIKRERIGVACPFICWSGAGRPSDPTQALLIPSLGITVL